MGNNFQQQDVTAIEDMMAVGNLDGVKDILELFEGYIKKGNVIRLYRKPVNGNQEIIAELRNENELKAYREKLLGENE